MIMLIREEVAKLRAAILTALELHGGGVKGRGRFPIWHRRSAIALRGLSGCCARHARCSRPRNGGRLHDLEMLAGHDGRGVHAGISTKF